jgi:hypothetical protein
MKCSHCGEVVRGATLVSDTEIRCLFCNNLMKSPYKTNIREVAVLRQGICPYCGEYNLPFKYTNTTWERKYVPLICQECNRCFGVKAKAIECTLCNQSILGAILVSDTEIRCIYCHNLMKSPYKTNFQEVVKHRRGICLCCGEYNRPYILEDDTFTCRICGCSFETSGAELGVPPPISSAFPLSRKVIYAILGLVVSLAVLFQLVFQWQGMAGLLIVGQMALLTITICLTPTIAYHLTKRWGRVARAALETLLFLTLLFGFGYWLLGAVAFGVWLIYGTALILLLEAGGHFVEHHKVVTLKRLAKSVSFKNMQSDAEAFEEMHRSEWTLYTSVPIGLVIGTVIGLVRNQTPEEILTLCLQLVLLLASLVLLLFLVYAFAQMKDPLFRTTVLSVPQIIDEQMKKRNGFISKIVRALRFRVPRPRPKTIDQEQKDLDLACMVADLRRIYLYDSVHNVILLVAFATVVARLWGVPIDVKWLLVSLLGLSLLFNQLPYVLGQAALHEKVLERYEGVKRAEMAEKLKKYTPLFPTSDFLAALFTTSTAGGILYFLLDNFVKEALK